MLATARVAPGVHDAFATMVAAGTQITVISSLAIAAVRTFLVIQGLAEHVRHIVARTGPDRAVLPPAPDLITKATRERAIPVESCLFVGSTDIDPAAARAAGVDTVRHLTTAHATEPPAAPPPPPPNPWFDALSAPARK